MQCCRVAWRQHGGLSGDRGRNPVLGIPGNADQQISAAVPEESGAGIAVRVEDASEKRLARAFQCLLFEGRYRDAARKWATLFAQYDSGVLFREFLRDVLPAQDKPERS